jgi:hypothetical protein
MLYPLAAGSRNRGREQTYRGLLTVGVYEMDAMRRRTESDESVFRLDVAEDDMSGMNVF